MLGLPTLFGPSNDELLEAEKKKSVELEGDKAELEEKYQKMKVKYAQMKRERDAFKVSTTPAVAAAAAAATMNATTTEAEKKTTDTKVGSPVPPGSIIQSQSQQDPIPPSTPYGVYFPTFFTSPFLIDTTTSGATVGDSGQSPIPTSGTPFFSSTWKDINPVHVDGTNDDNTALQKRIKELELDNQTLREKLQKAATNNDELLTLLKKERETSKALRTQLESTAATATEKEITTLPPVSFLPSMNTFMPFLNHNIVVPTTTTSSTENRDQTNTTNTIDVISTPAPAPEIVSMNPSSSSQLPGQTSEQLDKELKSMLGPIQLTQPSIATNDNSISMVPLSMKDSITPAIPSSVPSVEHAVPPLSMAIPANESTEQHPSSSFLGVPVGLNIGIQDYNPLPMWSFSPNKQPPAMETESNDDSQTLREKLQKAATNNDELLTLLKKERETSKALRAQLESTAATATGKETIMGLNMSIEDYNPLPMWPFSPGKQPPAVETDSNDVAVGPSITSDEATADAAAILDPQHPQRSSSFLGVPMDVSFFNTGIPVSFAPLSVKPSKPSSIPPSQTTTTTRPEMIAVVDSDDTASNHKSLQVRALEMQLETEKAQITELQNALQTTVASKEEMDGVLKSVFEDLKAYQSQLELANETNNARRARIGELETRTNAYQTRIMELEASAAKDREIMIALQVSFDELNNEKRKRDENSGSNPLIERQNQLDKKEIMRLTMLVEEIKASSTVQGTVNPLVEKQREADRREILRLHGVIDDHQKSSTANEEEIVRLTRLLEATTQAATVAVLSSSSKEATAGAVVSGAKTSLPGNGMSESENGTTMALLLAERQAKADKQEIERLSMMLDETLVLLNETNADRTAAQEQIVELRGKVDSIRDVVINESTVRATEAQLMVVNRQLKEATLARDEADRELQAEKDARSSLIDEVEHLSDQLSSMQTQLERSNTARSEAETRAMALASQMSHTQNDLTQLQLVQTSHLAQISALEKHVKELENQLAVKESVMVVTSGSQTILPNPVTEHSSQTTNSMSIAGIPIHTQTTLHTSNMATNTVGDTPFVTATNEGARSRETSVQSTPEINQLQMKITALTNELAHRLDAQTVAEEAQAVAEHLEAAAEHRARDLEAQLSKNIHTIDQLNKQIAALETNNKPPTMMHMEDQMNRAKEDASMLRFQLIELQAKKTAIEGQSKIDTETIVLLRAKLSMYENNAMTNGSIIPPQPQPQPSSSTRHVGTNAYGDRSSSSAAAEAAAAVPHTITFSPPPAQQSTNSFPSSASSTSQPLQQPPQPSSSLDQRINDEHIKAIQTALHRFANDPQFITDLRRPLVMKAMKCWGGEDVSHFTDEDLDAIRLDPGVIRCYPQIKEVQRLCDIASVQFPMEQILRGGQTI